MCQALTAEFSELQSTAIQCTVTRSIPWRCMFFSLFFKENSQEAFSQTDILGMSSVVFFCVCYLAGFFPPSHTGTHNNHSIFQFNSCTSSYRISKSVFVNLASSFLTKELSGTCTLSGTCKISKCLWKLS